MIAPYLADQLRAIIDTIVPEPGLSPDDPELLELKRLLRSKITEMECKDVIAAELFAIDGE